MLQGQDQGQLLQGQGRKFLGIDDLEAAGLKALTSLVFKASGSTPFINELGSFLISCRA
jgi:hypothetical protein